MKKYILTLTVLTFFCLANANAQSLSPAVIASGGDYSENSGFSVSWTIGELITETIASSSITLTQGFQQPDESLISSSQWNSASFDVHIYPNPTQEKIWIIHKQNAEDESTVELYDMNGQKILTRKMLNDRLKLDINNLSSGTYLLRILTSKGYQTFKIIKQ